MIKQCNQCNDQTDTLCAHYTTIRNDNIEVHKLHFCRTCLMNFLFTEDPDRNIEDIRREVNRQIREELENDDDG